MALPPLPRSPEDDHAPAALEARRRLCTAASSSELAHVAGLPVDPESARGNIENAIGYAQVPLGAAGPLRWEGAAGAGEVYVPMATTEGALVASYSRGMKLMAAAGGARARVLAESLTQHPVLVYGNGQAAEEAARRALALRPEMEALVAEVTSHGRLLDVRPEVVGRRLVLVLSFATGDAIGINMAALATERCSTLLARSTGCAQRYLHGEDVEKRANARALHEGRGRSTVAEVTVPADVLFELMRVRPSDLVAIQRTYAVGFARLGTQNWLVQAANGLAAVFLACGQDVAYVTECATGHLDFDVTPEGDLYASAYLPSLLVGTVGGGSGQGTALECLQLLGVAGDGGANRFAEILAATVLAGDLSLMASFATHEFVGAHERLGRNRPRADGSDA